MKANYETKPETASGNLNLSLYDLNKGVIKQLPDLTPEQILAATKEIDSIDFTYQMLLSRDINYYTVFVHDRKAQEETLGMAVISCLQYLGPIKSIERTKDGAFECWVVYNDEPIVLYLFDYSGGVIECL